jgi:branched-chain amino acid transport system permease protein
MLYASVGLAPIVLIKGFEAAAIGGIGNNRGALLAGYILGIAEALGAVVLSPGYQQATTFALMLVILLIRPQGLLGQRETRYV